jgi:hypothetical protein
MRLYELIQIDESIEIGDHFDLELDDLVIETVVVDVTEDGIIIEADDTALSYLSLDEGDKPRLASFNDRPRRIGPGSSPDDYQYTKYTPKGKEAGEKWAVAADVAQNNLKLASKKKKPSLPTDTGFYKNYLSHPPRREGVADGPADEPVEPDMDADDKRWDDLDEAKYQGREVPLGKPMAGDVKKKKVYVRKPDGKVVKVNFGDKKMRIKKSNPKRRKSFRARHNCKNPGPRWKARYWSCRAW